MTAYSGVGPRLASAIEQPKPDPSGASLIGTEPTAVLVTGMHRNGTSALARTLSLLGAALPNDLVPANEGNPTGHWEPQGMVELNDRMLASAGSDLYSVIDIGPDWFDTRAAALFTAEASHLIEQSFKAESLVVLKDPRTALLAPVWNRALDDCGYRVVHVLPLRHPSEVAESLRRRHLKSFPYDAWAEPRGEAVWLRYTLAAVRGSRGHARAFLRYGDLLDDWRREVGRIGRELGVDWPRRDPASEAEVDAFLHVNDLASGNYATAETEGGSLAELDLVQLASACFKGLVEHGDDGDRCVDAIHAELSARIAGTRDLICMLEGLYPLVWHHYESGRTMRQQLDAALAVEGNLRATTQRHWAALSSANDERRHLQSELGSRDRQIASLRSALSRLEPRDASAGDETGQLRDEIARLTDLAAEGGADQMRREAEDAETRRLLAVARDDAETLARAATAMRSSTSWRITAPLRAFARAVRRRP